MVSPFSMSVALLAAAALLVLIGAAHSILGERYILIRLFRRDNLPKLFGGDWFTKQTLRFAWHITTVAWLGFAALLGVAAAGVALDTQRVLDVVAATFLATGLIALVASRGRHFSWPVFLAVAALTWFA